MHTLDSAAIAAAIKTMDDTKQTFFDIPCPKCGKANRTQRAAFEQRDGAVKARSLHVRKDHNTSAETVAGLKSGDKITILETWTENKNTWARIGDGQWAAIVYNDETLIEFA
jgi:hypothetical protein